MLLKRPFIYALAVVLLVTGLSLGWWLRQRQTVLELPGVVREIRALNELATVKYRVQKVVGLEEAKPYLGAERLLLIVQADVAGGIDLSQPAGMQA